MGRFFTKTVATALAVLMVAYLIDGVTVESSVTALLVAFVLGLLNHFVKPILIILTIPITFLTFGLFLLFINVLIVYMVSEIVPGFHVDDWLTALLFSFLVSFFSYLIESIIGRPTDRPMEE